MILSDLVAERSGQLRDVSPWRLVSALDMFEILGHKLAGLVQVLAWMQAHGMSSAELKNVKLAVTFPPGVRPVPLDIQLAERDSSAGKSFQERMPASVPFFEMVAESCREAELRLSAIHAERIVEELRSRPMDFEGVGSKAGELLQRIQDELSQQIFLNVSPAKAELFRAQQPFGSDVVAKFPSVSLDIEEASRCMALDRFTACVFHLMRVCEAGLVVIAKRIGYPESRPNWEPVLKYIESNVQKKRDELDTLFKGNVDFLAGVAAHMRDVNIAWRRRVAHIDSVYDEAQASRIYTATKNLMEHLAGQLGEPADCPPDTRL